MKLSWTGSEFMQAQTPFGSYSVERDECSGWKWGYCFDEYYDEDKFSCDSKAEGKRLAEENWQGRIEPIIAPYLNPNTPAKEPT